MASPHAAHGPVNGTPSLGFPSCRPDYNSLLLAPALSSVYNCIIWRPSMLDIGDLIIRRIHTKLRVCFATSSFHLSFCTYLQLVELI